MRIYAVINGIKNDALHDLDQSIYDWEKAYEVSSDEKLTMYMPIKTNGFDILKTLHYLQRYLNTYSPAKTFTINGSQKVLIENNSVIKQITILHNIFEQSYVSLQFKIYFGFLLQQGKIYTTTAKTQLHLCDVNLTISHGYLKIKLINSNLWNKYLNILIKYIV